MTTRFKIGQTVSNRELCEEFKCGVSGECANQTLKMR